VIADTELMTAAASDLAGIGSNLNAAHLTAAASGVAVIPAAADEVSAGIAHLFSAHAQDYQALAAQASAFHEDFVQHLTASEDFVQHLTASAASYASIEAAIASLLHDLNSSADSFTSAIATLPGQILKWLNGAFDYFVSLLDFIVSDPAGFLEGSLAIALIVVLAPIWIPLAILYFAYLLNLAAMGETGF